MTPVGGCGFGAAMTFTLADARAVFVPVAVAVAWLTSMPCVLISALARRVSVRDLPAARLWIVQHSWPSVSAVAGDALRNVSPSGSASQTLRFFAVASDAETLIR